MLLLKNSGLHQEAPKVQMSHLENTLQVLNTILFKKSGIINKVTRGAKSYLKTLSQSFLNPGSILHSAGI